MAGLSSGILNSEAIAVPFLRIVDANERGSRAEGVACIAARMGGILAGRRGEAEPQGSECEPGEDCVDRKAEEAEYKAHD